VAGSADLPLGQGVMYDACLPRGVLSSKSQPKNFAKAKKASESYLAPSIIHRCKGCCSAAFRGHAVAWSVFVVIVIVVCRFYHPQRRGEKLLRFRSLYNLSCRMPMPRDSISLVLSSRGQLAKVPRGKQAYLTPQHCSLHFPAAARHREGVCATLLLCAVTM